MRKFTDVALCDRIWRKDGCSSPGAILFNFKELFACLTNDDPGEPIDPGLRVPGGVNAVTVTRTGSLEERRPDEFTSCSCGRFLEKRASTNIECYPHRRISQQKKADRQDIAIPYSTLINLVPELSTIIVTQRDKRVTLILWISSTVIEGATC